MTGKPYTLHRGDCLDVMRTMPDNSIDAIVTDPPYELGFMGKAWDASGIANSVEMWREALRVLKPGGHLLAFSGSRTYHRMVCAIEDAGFDIRDQIMWVYGSGFPKSLDVSKAIDKRGGNAGLTVEIGAAIKAARIVRKMSVSECDRIFCGGSTNWTWFEGRPNGQRAPTTETFATIAAAWPELAPLAAAVAEAEREVIGQRTTGIGTGGGAVAIMGDGSRDITAPATEAARQWDGWGTALKPAHEPICVARKPLVGTIAANVLHFGTGALNIDGCRVEFTSDTDKASAKPGGKATARPGNLAGKAQGGFVIVGQIQDDEPLYWSNDDGWVSRPAATIFYDEAITNPVGATGREMAQQRAEFTATQGAGRWPANVIHDGSAEVVALFPANAGAAAPVHKRNGDTSRNSYGAFAGNIDEAGSTFHGDTGSAARFFYCAKATKVDRSENNIHPTVKPVDLMAYLVRLVTPPGGVVLDPFTGSGSTGKACMREGFRFIGIDKDADQDGNPLGYLAIAEARIEHELTQVATAAEQAAIAAAQLDLFAATPA